MSTVATLNPYDFLRVACADTTALTLVVDNTSRCLALPIASDRLNGDCTFEVLRWTEGEIPTTDGATVRIEARHQGAVHTFAGTLRVANAHVLGVTRPLYTGKVQRRAWLRMPTDPKSWARLRTDDSARVRPLRDVSAGGVQVRLRDEDTDIRPGSPLRRVEFGLGEQVFVHAATVRRVAEIRAPQGIERIGGIELLRLTEADRDRLMHWVIDREREVVLERRRGVRGWP